MRPYVNNEIPAGQKAILFINIGGYGDFEFKWRAERGKLTDENKSRTTYTAPETPGEDTVTAEVEIKGVSGPRITRTLTVKVIERAFVTATATSAPTSPPVPPTSAAMVTPTLTGTSLSFHRYTVRAEDTLTSIAERFYLDEKQWRKIYEINRETIGQVFFPSDLPPVRAGQILHLPDLPREGLPHDVELGDHLQRIASLYYGDFYQELQNRICEKNKRVIGSDCNRLSPGQVLIIPLLEPLPDRAFLVRPGDTLWDIARAFYNDPSLSSLIYEQEDNKKVIGPDPSQLKAGIILTLPLREPPVAVTNYTVEAEDTFQTIANSCYGSEEKYIDIHLANRDITGYDFSFLQPGQKLKLYGCIQ